MVSMRAALTKPFSYTINNKEAMPLSLGGQLWHYRDAAFHEANVAFIAGAVASELQGMARLSPREAAIEPELVLIRKFLKIFNFVI